jgi:cytochrome c nitrite reductase small subunit
MEMDCGDKNLNTIRLIRWLRVALVVVSGLGLGLGLYTFRYAQGASYLSDDPRACVNCHVMRDVYEDWKRASHHAVASCNDCHVPHDFFGKYLAKAANGYHHSVAFTLQNFPEPIRIKPANAAHLQDNCLRCHGALLDDVLAHRAPAAQTLSCVQCHAEVGHGPRR